MVYWFHVSLIEYTVDSLLFSHFGTKLLLKQKNGQTHRWYTKKTILTADNFTWFLRNIILIHHTCRNAVPNQRQDYWPTWKYSKQRNEPEMTWVVVPGRRVWIIFQSQAVRETPKLPNCYDCPHLFSHSKSIH